MQREQLTQVILSLLGAWGDPLLQLYRSMSQDQNQDFNHYSSNKVLEIGDMVHELRDGVAKMAGKVRIRLWLLSLYMSFVVLTISDFSNNVWMCVVFEIHHILVENNFILITYCMHLNAFVIYCPFSFHAPQMKLSGVLGNTVGYISPEGLVPSSSFSFYKQGELNSIDHHDLLYCFRRDSNKIKNYLQILKCTTLPGLDC